MPSVFQSLRKPSLDWLLVCVPIAIGAELTHASPTFVFVVSAVAIIPLAGWMGHATEHLASRLGAGIGGLLNATLGNAAEVIIAGTAIVEAARHPEKLAFMHGMVKASITGSIIGNILLVLGVALLAGGLRFRIQTFNATAVRAGTTLLLLATAAMAIPALFAHVAPGATSAVRALSLELALLLLVVYVLSLVFTLRTHRELYLGAPDPHEDGEQSSHAPWSVRRALIVLVVVTVFIALLAEFMVGSIEAASKAIGMSEVFAGVIVVAIVGNAAEHSTAVLVAWRNRMDLALSIAIGSSIQIALLIAPLLVLFSAALGSTMDLVFTGPEVLAVALAVLVVSQIAGDGESHWLEGVLLLTLYAMLAVLFFHLPA